MIQAKEKDLADQVGEDARADLCGDACADLGAGAAEEEPSNRHMRSPSTHLGHEDDDEEEQASLPHTGLPRTGKVKIPPTPTMTATLGGVVIPGLQDDSDDESSLEFRVRKHLRHYGMNSYA